jgi:hypothetical protein
VVREFDCIHGPRTGNHLGAEPKNSKRVADREPKCGFGTTSDANSNDRRSAPLYQPASRAGLR